MIDWAEYGEVGQVGRMVSFRGICCHVLDQSLSSFIFPEKFCKEKDTFENVQFVAKSLMTCILGEQESA